MCQRCRLYGLWRFVLLSIMAASLVGDPAEGAPLAAWQRRPLPREQSRPERGPQGDRLARVHDGQSDFRQAGVAFNVDNGRGLFCSRRVGPTAACLPS